LRHFARITKAISAGDSYTELTFVAVPSALATEDYVEKLVPGFFSDTFQKKPGTLREVLRCQVTFSWAALTA